ncbi:MAG TPA: hypothetical protein PK668_08095 [Myxococcota bacterium]|nr:hypothetical protein [Myxococcota bacterium]HRY93064.1 hypothetical protein [Myxococcota bacterium]
MGRVFVGAGVLALAALGAGGCGGQEEGPPPCLVQGCDGARLCERAADPEARGPWPVGARTLQVAGLTTEVWYPAEFGSQRGLDPVVYDVRAELPLSEQGKIPDRDTPWQTCDCHRDLPLDAERGPYPVLLYMHGTAAFRSQSLTQMTHWASRGFVVVAADHPGLYLADMLDFQGEAHLEADGQALLAALRAPGGELAFLAGHVDAGRVGLSGHSAGGKGVSTFGSEPGVRVIAPMAYAGVEPGTEVESVLVLGALDDRVAAWTRQQEGYASSPAPRRLVGIADAGHLVFTDLCALKNAAGQDLIEIALEHEVQNASLAELLWDGCAPEQIAPAEGWAIVNHVTTAVFESVLQCQPAPDFSDLQARHPRVAVLEEDLSAGD